MSNVLRVDMIRCFGNGVCAELFPEWIDVDDWGYPIVRSVAVPAHLLKHARRAVHACPAAALSLTTEEP